MCKSPDVGPSTLPWFATYMCNKHYKSVVGGVAHAFYARCGFNVRNANLRCPSAKPLCAWMHAAIGRC